MNAEPVFCTDHDLVAESGTEVAIILSVIIATFKTRTLLSDCLQSIYENPPSEPYEIIVVDDASKDGTSAMVRSRFPAVRLLRNDVNRNYAYSNNRALKEARGEYLLLLNSDTIVLPQALDIMLTFLKKHPEAGVVGCRLLNADGSTQWSVKSLPNAGSAVFGARSIIARVFPGNRYSRKHLLHLGRDMVTPFVVDHGYVSGASAMIPRKVINDVGYLDENLFYHVDADHCKRISEAGYKCYYVPTAAVIHLEHKGGTAIDRRVRFRSLLRFEVNSYSYYRKHIRRSPWSPMQIVVALGLVVHFSLSAAAQAWNELSAGLRSLLHAKSAAAKSQSSAKG